MSKPDGGPAFPIKGYCADASGALCGEVMLHQGMSLRDYFAAHALNGFISILGECIEEYDNEPVAFAEHQAEVAKTVYGYADTMLKEREK